jgi:signal transduction histidine kinase
MIVMAGALIALIQPTVVEVRNADAQGPFGRFEHSYTTLPVVDRGDMVKTIIVVTVVGVTLVGVVGWLTARRAVKPLSEALTLQRHFVADASHELRTPLTVLSTRIQLLQRRLDQGKDPQATVAKLRQDAAGMADVLNDLLLTVEGAGEAVTTPTPVQAAVAEAVDSLKLVADAANVTLRVTGAFEGAVAVPARSLSRAVVALTDNAIQHSPAGSTVTVDVASEAAGVAIRVRDQGAGIADPDPNRLFERFAHGPESGRRRSFGLGLALVSEIAQRNHGDIAIESTGPEGTVFVLRFPLAA